MVEIYIVQIESYNNNEEDYPLILSAHSTKERATAYRKAYIASDHRDPDISGTKGNHVLTIHTVDFEPRMPTPKKKVASKRSSKTSASKRSSKKSVKKSSKRSLKSVKKSSKRSSKSVKKSSKRSSKKSVKRS